MARILLRLVLVFGVLGSLLVLAPPRPAHAAGIVVNTSADGIANDSQCSLREAIYAANMDVIFNGCTAGSGADVITFAAGYIITLSSQLPVVTTNITINGKGVNKTVIQANAAPHVSTYRLFTVIAPGWLTLKNLTGRNGRCVGACPFAAQDGGGIYNSGKVTLINSRLSGNLASNAGGGIMNVAGGTLAVSKSTISGNNAGLGAGIFNTGMLTMGRSTLSSNSSIAGGGILNQGGGVQIVNSTFGNNSAATLGGGLYNAAGPVQIDNSTFSANNGSPGASLYNASSLYMKNTILANAPAGPDCYNAGIVFDYIHNLIETNAPPPYNCGGVWYAGDPHLGPLVNNGGPTRTFALLPGSQAIDNGDDVTCKTIDQRGTARPQGSHCDVGSYELKQEKMHFRSVAAEDGWVLESTETSGVGGTRNSTSTTFRLGDSAADQQYRAILSFNTSALPDTAVITGAVLRIRRQGVTGTSPFTGDQVIIVEIKKGRFSGNAALELADFQASSSTTPVGVIENYPTAFWYSSDLINTAFPYVNLAGRTQFRLQFNLGDNDDQSADYLSFYSGNYSSAADDRPLLTIQYYTP